MSSYFHNSYVAELENLILHDLLPIYERWHKDNEVPITFSFAHPELIKEIKRKQELPALLRKKTC